LTAAAAAATAVANAALQAEADKCMFLSQDSRLLPWE
jgi:hypothetical protein